MEIKNLKLWHGTLVFYFLWAVYHTIRDVLQLLDVNTFIATIGHRRPNWCIPFGDSCNYITFPIEIYVLIAVPLVWNRKKIGTPEVLILLTLPITLLMWLFP